MQMDDPYLELTRRWKALRATHDISVREVACVMDAPAAVRRPRTLLCAELGDGSLPSVALAAGVHGDEPAGVWALLDLAESRSLDPRFAYRIWPCTNPTGFAAGTRANEDGVDVNRTFGRGGQSPEARAIVTANRDRKFLLSLDLHEDVDAAGFYHYEYGGGDIGRAVLAAFDAAGLPVDPLETTFDLAGPLDDACSTRERGRVVADHRQEAVLLGGLSYSLAIARHAARHVLTFETPARAPWESRSAMHRLAVVTAIAAAAAGEG
jgi:murein peptide amidase A